MNTRRPRVVLTASPGGFRELAEAARRAGAETIEHPLISFAPPEDWADLDRALADLDRFAAIAVTSPRAAAALAERLPRTPCLAPVWVSGPATRLALRDTCGTVHDAGSGVEGAAEAVAGAMLKSGVGSPVFFPCGDLRRDALPARLRAAGITVEEAICYRTILASADSAADVSRDADLVVVASPSVARLLVQALDHPPRPRLWCTGPTTVRAASEAGWPPDLTCGPGSIADFTSTLARVLASPRSP